MILTARRIQVFPQLAINNETLVEESEMRQKINLHEG